MPIRLLCIVISLAVLFDPAIARAQEAARPADGASTNERLAARIGQAKLPGAIRSALGVTRHGTVIPCLLTRDDLDLATNKTRILLIGGLDGDDRSVQATLDAMQAFYRPEDRDPELAQKPFAMSALPCAHPDGWGAHFGGPKPTGNPARGYPPRGDAYNSPTDPEAAYLWRWIGMHAPDLVVDVRSAQHASIRIPASRDPQLSRLAGVLLADEPDPAADELVSQLVRTKACDVGTIPAIQIHIADGKPEFLNKLLAAIAKSGFSGPSPARRELHARLNRTPVEVATQLSKVYGHELNQVVYIPAVALIGRVRLGELTGQTQHLADVERIVAPYFSGQKPSLPERPSGSDLSGHLVFGELARATGKPRYIELVRAAADLGFDNGQPKEVMPFHNEMSDAVFMGCPILAQAGRLTGETRYYEMCLRNMRYMLKLNLRDDGLHRHSPLDETAWGRGNGFPALGLTWSLSEMPEEYPGRSEMLKAFQAHMAALAPHQDPTGAWHQVIDRPESYRELSCTAMITYAMARGVQSGWLDRATFAPRVERGWHAVRTRVAADGGLVDVCTGTGKQKSLRDYYDRTAILGRDARGGAMAMLVATEMARWEVLESRREAK